MNPQNLNIEQLKKQAKELLQTWNSAPQSVKKQLAQAQHEVAKKYGYTNWAEMKHALESFLEKPFDPDNWVLNAMMRPTIAPLPEEEAGKHFYVALCKSDLETVKAMIERGELSANQVGGPLNAEPIVYACCSYAATSQVLELAIYLLDNGANVNATYEDPSWPGAPLGCLYGACGRQFNPDLANLLLDAGAEINDNESVYHSTESENSACLQLLLRRGAKLEGTNGLLRALDFDRIEPVKLLLQAGADPNEKGLRENALHHAIRRGRSGEFATLLIQSGVNLEARSHDGFDLLTHATLRGGNGMVEALKTVGITPTKDDIITFATAVCLGDYQTADNMLQQNPKLPQKLSPSLVSILADAAWSQNLDRLKALLDYGWPIHGVLPGVMMAFHGNPASPLHVAAFVGNTEMVLELIKRGADVNRTESQFKATPIGWAAWASVNNSAKEGNHLACIQILLENGARVPDDYLRGNLEIDTLLESARMKQKE